MKSKSSNARAVVALWIAASVNVLAAGMAAIAHSHIGVALSLFAAACLAFAAFAQKRHTDRLAA
jgi:hypothetical protein